MPVIPEEAELVIPEPVIQQEAKEVMSEFINWDKAGPSVGAAPVDFEQLPPVPMATDQDEVGLFLENVDGDDFSFWALEHYAQTNMNPAPEEPVEDTAEGDNMLPGWATPAAPCVNCQKGGFQCKRIREGSYKGYCTSCVALRCECSFGLASATTDPTESATFPSNPWPTLGDHPNSIPHEEPGFPLITSAPSVDDLMLLVADQKTSPKTGPKIGTRFSRESVKILKNWLSTHSRHPYPTDDEKESLQRLTGLNKVQITNWLANARRRGKIQAPRSTSPHVKSWSGGNDIPQRRGTPSPVDIPQRRGTPFENMNPLQRWANSPPENEPASVTDIARAITTSSSSARSSGLDSPHSFNYTDDGSGKSLQGSSASSLGTSHSSGGSFASAYSHASRGSFGSFGSFDRGRRRRRRRVAPKRPDVAHKGPTSLAVPLKTFQCTFCTETFRTKHDWQRHEKSLHLSLERWVCAPSGPSAPNQDTKQLSCVFCGEANPDEAHIDSHNYSSCQERTLADRTFYRKDHLRQHLKLVHNVKFLNWSMEAWKVVTPEIRSRCGFCGIVMDTWTIRVDHLAEHFKTGNTMADWKGDWGFDAPVLEMVENSIPPYLIHDERNSPLPMSALAAAPASPRNAYELLKTELVYYLEHHRDAGKQPSDDEIQLEACRIVYGSEVLSKKALSATPSWLRDLVMSSEAIAFQAQLLPIRSYAESQLAALKINGKDNIFEGCHLEQQLREFVKAKSLLGLTPMDSELQIEACRIIGRAEESSNMPSDDVANLLVRLISQSKAWLADFRQRAHLPRSEDILDDGQRSKDPSTIDSTIHNYSRLELELAEYIKAQRSLGNEPDDASLQKQARIIIYEFDDGWNQTAADNPGWLAAFKSRHMFQFSPQAQSTSSMSPLSLSSVQKAAPACSTPDIPLATPAMFDKLGALINADFPAVNATTKPTKMSPFFINDMNCYRRLAKELARYVNATMSPNNPNCHVPSDQELQHQARWILYDDDDPWNQTAADNAEWLQRFKRQTGVLPDDDGPGLPGGYGWGLSQGGSGFAPPYTFPKTQLSQLEPLKAPVRIELREGAKAFETESSTVNKYLQGFTNRYQAPATIFCSRELENGLVEFTESELTKGQFPSDDALRSKARELLGTNATPADDAVLLAKFKEMVQAKNSPEQPALQQQTIPELPVDMDLTMTETELNDILQDMNFEFGADVDLGDVPLNS